MNLPNEQNQLQCGELKKMVDISNKITLEEDSFERQNAYKLQQIDQEISDSLESFPINPPVEIKQVINQQDFAIIFEPNTLNWRSGNTPRKIMQMALEYFPIYRSMYPHFNRRRINQICQGWSQWHLADKNNVFKLEHIAEFFVGMQNEFPGSDKINREIMNMILRRHSIDSMKKPRSQIKHKVQYLKVLKIFGMRCRNKSLILRNQSN